jgi:uncharacterized protein YndB with AHSA1/START domain
MNGSVTVSVSKSFDLPAERVYDAWLDPEKIRKWFSPGLGPMVRVEVDARVGGHFSFVQRREGNDMDHVGEYRVLDRPRRLAFTWGIAPEPPESVVSIEITPSDSGCDLVLTHEIPAKYADSAEKTKAGWSTLLDLIAGNA